MSSKRCTRCKETKLSAAFNRCCQTADSLQCWCKSCQSSWQVSYRETHRGYVAHGKSVLKWRASQKGRESYRRCRQRSPDKYPAHSAIHRAVRDGRLTRPDRCFRCHVKCRPQGHHHNGYKKSHQLDVTWLCQSCHQAAHT